MRSHILLATTLLFAAPAWAQSAVTPPAQSAAAQADPALTARIGELVGVLGGAGDYQAYFAPAFRAQIPRQKLDQLAQQLIASYGPITGIEKITPVSPWAAALTIGFRDGTGSARIAVDPQEPHQVTGLAISGFTGRQTSIAAVADAFRALPGRGGFAVAKLGDGAPQLLTTNDPDRPLAVGSAFKLAILAELVRETNKGERKWTDMVTIDGSPLPGGAYAMSLKGMQFSLRDVAAKMISVSDNSAADILLKLVGREKVEALLPMLGVANVAADRPFLSTLDMFKLKGIGKGALAARYLALGERGRRALLDGEVAAAPLSAIDPQLFHDGRPILIDRIEWFFTPMDLVRIMDWLRRNTATGPGVEARAILSINPGPLSPDAAARWRFVGYKGGSEPGVINMTLLLGGKDDSWYVVTGSWNDAAGPVDELKMGGLVGTAAGLIVP